ncbi:MAG: thioredoxin-disulfide reductase [SAR324 cluster bacterium]|nr:thioredoxin-disulfide reductase [SAR324 cluster bacterium]
MSENYDVIIIGAGPAGLTAALYTTRAGLNTLIIEKEMFGGALMNRDLIDNYPGHPEILGPDLASQMLEQATSYGAEMQMGIVEQIIVKDNQKIVKTDQDEYVGNAIIIAGGTHAKKLGIPGEEEFAGKGVIHCATCDGPLYREQVVAVVGGSNDAIYEALSLVKYTSKVLVIHRGDNLRAEKVLRERAFGEPKIEFIWDTTVTAVLGESTVSGIQLNNIKTGETSTLNVDGVCMAVGNTPNTDILAGIVKLGSEGAIPVNVSMETEVPGILAAGNIREDSPMRVASAIGDGATAAMAAERYINTTLR